MNESRLQRVLALMTEQHIPQLLISDPCSIFYLTGKWILPGERMLVLYLTTSGTKTLFINELFPLHDDLGVDVVWLNDTQDVVGILASHLNSDEVLGVDKNWPAHFLLGLMDRKAAKAFVNGSTIVDTVRSIKDNAEMDLMRHAGQLADLAVTKLIGLIPQGYTEQKMAKILTDFWHEQGADGHSFDPIIAYGPNGADPHHTTDGSLVKPGDSIIIDIGCKYKSYCSDTTRTVFYKTASDEQKKVYQIVRDANLKAIDAVKAGVPFCDIDAAARDYITAKGYGKYFTHRLGHSCGIEDHEVGDVSSANTNRIQPGQVFSIEPGIYLTGNFGVRIEDLVIATEDGCELLNHTSKDLQIIE